jgi:hypothetical protein
MAKRMECPYTGKTVSIRPVQANGQLIGYRVAGAWSPNRTFASLDDMGRSLLRRGATFLEPKDGEVLKCPYTGAAIVPFEVPDGFRPTGMFDPDRLFHSYYAAEYAFMMRDGVPAEGTDPDLPVEGVGQEVSPADEIVRQEEEKAAARATPAGIVSHQPGLAMLADAKVSAAIKKAKAAVTVGGSGK